MEYRPGAADVFRMVMDVAHTPASRVHAESAAEPKARVACEADIIAQAHADIDAGLGIEDEDMEAWLDARERGEQAPLPVPDRKTV
jgi:hypothetical protein